jgi:hypothetical protein
VSWSRCYAVGGPGGGVPAWTGWIFAYFSGRAYLSAGSIPCLFVYGIGSSGGSQHGVRLGLGRPPPD